MCVVFHETVLHFSDPNMVESVGCRLSNSDHSTVDESLLGSYSLRVAYVISDGSYYFEVWLLCSP